VAHTILRQGSITAVDYQCSVGPADEPFTELHRNFSVAYVRKGTFGYRARGESFELVAGSLLIGNPGEEYVCTHEHAYGDECLVFHFAPALAEAIGDRTEIWRAGCLPPLPQLMILGELAQAAASGKSDVGLDEAGMLLGARFGELERAIAAALWKRRSGWTRTPTSQSIWTLSPAALDSARFIFCVFSPRFSE